jgi:hypothetical protein
MPSLTNGRPGGRVNSILPLTLEERFLWECARSWRDPGALTRAPNLDWNKLVTIAVANKMGVLLHDCLEGADLLADLPDSARETLLEDVRRLNRLADAYAAELGPFLHLAAGQGIEVVVLKGLALSRQIYGRPAARPGGDIDLLVRDADVERCLTLLEKLGHYRWYRLLDDRYYRRHHLHQIRGRRDTRIWFEVHWALDHPYTLLTIDYEALLDRTTPGRLLDEAVRDLSPADLLLSLAVHLVKHAVYLAAVLDRPDLPRVILADGLLMYYVDVAEVIGWAGADLDWTQVVGLAREWGAVDIAGAVLRVCRDHLQAGVPDWVLAELPVSRRGRFHTFVMNSIVRHEVATYLGEQSSRWGAFLVGYNESFVLRPVRVLDALAFCFPPANFLRRRYGRAGLGAALRHLLRALGRIARNLLDVITFTWDYRRRLKPLDQAREAAPKRAESST